MSTPNGKVKLMKDITENEKTKKTVSFIAKIPMDPNEVPFLREARLNGKSNLPVLKQIRILLRIRQRLSSFLIDLKTKMQQTKINKDSKYLYTITIQQIQNKK